MSVLNENQLLGASGASTGGYEIEQSLRLNIDTPKWIKRTPSSASNRKTWTLSMWHKRGAVGRNLTEMLFKGGGSGGSGIVAMHLTNSSYGDQDKIWLSFDGATTCNPVTNRVLRDPSGWMHIVLRFDTTQSTVTDRARLYINGELIISTDYTFLWSTSWAGITQNSDWNVNNSGIEHSFGAHQTNQPLDGYLADIAFVDGQSLGPDSFGETGTYGEWKPIDVSELTFGTNGYHLDFADSSSLGNDANGSNNFTTVGIAAADQMVDSPTNNFAVMNPLTRLGVTGTNSQVFSQGNLRMSQTAALWACYGSTHSMTTGKYYWEMFMAFTGSGGTDVNMGMVVSDFNRASAAGIDTVGAYSLYAAGAGNGVRYDNSASGTDLGSGYHFTWGDIVQVAYDADSGKMWVAKNGTWFGSGNPATGANPFLTVNATNKGNLIPAFSQYHAHSEIIANFGQDSSFAGAKTPQSNSDANDIGDFYYAPPTGYLALCTANLPSVDVIPSEHFNTVLYTGNSSSNAITVGFSPDMSWFKVRSEAGYHQLYDTVRGASARLITNATIAEATTSNGFAGWQADGFSLDSSGGGGDVNVNGRTYVGWNWKAGGSASSNTNGTITSSVSANVDAGFSIVSYTGTAAASATIGHGLTLKIPEMVIVKKRDEAGNWIVYTEPTGKDNKLNLNETTASATSALFNNVAPTSTVFSVKDTSTDDTFGDGHTYIAYCFHSVDGYSKVGSYTGNGDADGTFVYTGFRPAYVMIKRTDAGQDWMLFDSARNLFNATDNYLQPNASAAEAAGIGDGVDFTSNGVKIRSTNNTVNASGGTFIYLCFAESPFKHSNAK